MTLEAPATTGCRPSTPLGTGTASDPDSATTDTQQDTSACASDGAVPDAANNLGLVSDCEALLDAEDTLRGAAGLNWAADTPISQWDGITVGGTPRRVTRLDTSGAGLTELTGTIPPELGNLTSLTNLRLSNNKLTGQIPSSLGSLANLQGLYLSSNQLTGQIPSELGSLAKLEVLHLDGNQLTGEIPPELGSLATLERLRLFNNQLTGPIPTWLGNLANLEVLSLRENQLTGEIPAELGSLTNLVHLVLSGNQLTGEITRGTGRPHQPANSVALWQPVDRLHTEWLARDRDQRLVPSGPAVLRHAGRSDHRHSNRSGRRVPDRSLGRSHQHRQFSHHRLPSAATSKTEPPINPTPTGLWWKTCGPRAPVPCSTP